MMTAATFKRTHEAELREMIAYAQRAPSKIRIRGLPS